MVLHNIYRNHQTGGGGSLKNIGGLFPGTLERSQNYYHLGLISPLVFYMFIYAACELKDFAEN